MKILLANGDSWTYGSEIVSPAFLAAPGEEGFGKGKMFKRGYGEEHAANTAFRTSKIWPTKLAKMLNAKPVNLAKPARSNDVIYAETVAWVLKYLSEGSNPDDLIVVIGWSNPERRMMLMTGQDKEQQESMFTVTLWADFARNKYPAEFIDDFLKFYVTHLDVEAEYIARYVEQNFNLHVFLKSYGIKHVFFNAFWMPGGMSDEWVDTDLQSVLDKWKELKIRDTEDDWAACVDHVKNMWRAIPEDVYRFKNTLRSFKWYVENSLNIQQKMANTHPTPDSHLAWANYLKLIL